MVLGTAVATVSYCLISRITEANSITIRGIEMKKCTKCGETREISMFAKAPSCLDGHRSTCRVCNRAQDRAKSARWRAKNPDRVREIQKAWRDNNPVDPVERKKYHDANVQYYRDKSREAYHANKERYSAENKLWMQLNKEKRAAYSAKYREENKERRKQSYAEWEKNNLPARLRINANRRARIVGNGGVLSRGIREKLFSEQNGKCACCGLPLGEKYHLDHIQPISKGGKNTDDNVQLLRVRCNLQKKDKDPIEFMKSRKEQNGHTDLDNCLP